MDVARHLSVLVAISERCVGERGVGDAIGIVSRSAICNSTISCSLWLASQACCIVLVISFMVFLLIEWYPDLVLSGMC